MSSFSRFRLFIFTRTFTHRLVQVTWWFLASDGSEIQARVEDFRPNLKLHLKYTLPTFSHFDKKFCVIVVCGLFIFNTQSKSIFNMYTLWVS